MSSKGSSHLGLDIESYLAVVKETIKLVCCSFSPSVFVADVFEGVSSQFA